MFRDESANRRQYALEICQIDRAQRLPRRHRHLEDDEPGTRRQNAGRFGEAGIEIRQIARTPAHHGAVEGRRPERQRERVGRDRCRALALVPSVLKHRLREVGGHDTTTESGTLREGGGEIERARTEVEIRPLGCALPVEPVHGGTPPAQVEPEAHDSVQAVVGRGDGGEELPHVRPLLRTP